MKKISEEIKLPINVLVGGVNAPSHLCKNVDGRQTIIDSSSTPAKSIDNLRTTSRHNDTGNHACQCVINQMATDFKCSFEWSSCCDVLH